LPQKYNIRKAIANFIYIKNTLKF